MIFWNLYSDYDTTEHSIEFENVKTLNPTQITRIQEIEEDGLKYTRFYGNNSDRYYYPGTLEEFNEAVEKTVIQYYKDHPHLVNPDYPHIERVICCPTLDESTFMFTSMGKSEAENENSDFLLENPKTLTINLDNLKNTMCKCEVKHYEKPDET